MPNTYLRRLRRSLTASASPSSSFTESSQPRQASVMLCPKVSGLPGLEVLAAFDQVRLDHHADDAPLAAGDLARRCRAATAAWRR